MDDLKEKLNERINYSTLTTEDVIALRKKALEYSYLALKDGLPTASRFEVANQMLNYILRG